MDWFGDLDTKDEDVDVTEDLEKLKRLLMIIAIF